MVILKGPVCLQTDLDCRLMPHHCFELHEWRRQDLNPIELLFPKSAGGRHLEFHHVMSSRENPGFSHLEYDPAIGRVPGDLRRGRRAVWTSQPTDWTALPICCSSVFVVRFVSSSLLLDSGRVWSIFAGAHAIFGHSACLQCSLWLSMNPCCTGSQIGHWRTADLSYQQPWAGPHFWAHSSRVASLFYNNHHRNFQVVHLYYLLMILEHPEFWRRSNPATKAIPSTGSSHRCAVETSMRLASA